MNDILGIAWLVGIIPSFVILVKMIWPFVKEEDDPVVTGLGGGAVMIGASFWPILLGMFAVSWIGVKLAEMIQ